MSETLVYTLRLWRQQAQFRAALRAVGEERTELFTEPAAVVDFLRQASEPKACDMAEPGAGAQAPASAVAGAMVQYGPTPPHGPPCPTA